MTKSLMKEIKEIYDSGITTKKGIIEELQRRNRSFTKNTINSYFTFIKSTRQMDNTPSSTSSDSSVSNRINNSDRPIQETSERLETETQPQQKEEIKREIETPSLQGSNQGEINTEESRSPIKNSILDNSQIIKSSGKFNIDSLTADTQPEAQIMSDSYKQDFIPPQDPNVKLIPVKLSRIGNFTGDITQAVLTNDRIKEATGNYEMQDEEIRMINEDAKEVLENRLKVVSSEYGDLINLALGYVTLSFKIIVHKIKNPKVKKVIEKEIKKEEDKIINEINQQKESISEAGEVLNPVTEENLLCQSCSKMKIFKHGLCQKCYFDAELLRGQNEFDGNRK